MIQCNGMVSGTILMPTFLYLMSLTILSSLYFIASPSPDLLHLIECHSKLARLFYANRKATLPKFTPAVLALPAPSDGSSEHTSTALALHQQNSNNGRKPNASLLSSSSFAPTHPSPQLISNTLSAAGGVTRIVDEASEIGAFVAASNRSHLAGMFLHELQWPSVATTALMASQGAASQNHHATTDAFRSEGGHGGGSNTIRSKSQPLSVAQTESLRHELACLNLVSHELIYQVL